jgi:hypothetical protein
MMSAFSHISLVAIVAASFAVMMLGWLWFAVLFARPYAVVLGRRHDPQAKMGPLYIVGPSLCMVVTTVAMAVLMKATGVASLPEAIGLGALIGIGLLASTAVNMAINPNIPRPIAYGAMSASYFLVASVMISAILYLV